MIKILSLLGLSVATLLALSNFEVAQKLFESRMFQYINMDLFVHEYSKSQAEILHKDAEKRIMNLKKFLF